MRSREHKPRGDDEQSWNEYIGHADISHEEIAAARIGSTVRQIREKWNEILEKRVEERIKLDRNQLRKLDQREQQVLILLEENVLEGNQLEEKTLQAAAYFHAQPYEVVIPALEALSCFRSRP